MNEIRRNQEFRKLLPFLLNSVVILIGLSFGLASSHMPLILGGCAFLAAGLYCLINYFEKTVIALVLVRTALDPFSQLGLTSLYGLSIHIITIISLGLKLLRREKIHADWFVLFFFSWIAIQSIWVILLPLNSLGLGASHFSTAIREWIRIAAFPMLYLLVMQLKTKIHPEKLASILFCSLAIPLTIATVQVFMPSILPEFLVPREYGTIETSSRIGGTMGHPNGFATFLIVFISLTFWKFNHSRLKPIWSLLFGVIAFFLVSTKAIIGLVMAGTSLVALVLFKAKPLNLVGVSILLSLIFLLFSSSGYGADKLSSIYNTPLLNPEISWSRAVLTSWYDNNSFNWRIAQWTFLIDAWKEHPILGYGLQSSALITVKENYAHNDYVRSLAEGGIIGFTSFIVLLVAQLFRILQLLTRNPSNHKQKDFCLTLLAIFISMLVGMLTENIWSQTVLYFYWFTLMALAGWDWDTGPSNPPALEAKG